MSIAFDWISKYDWTSTSLSTNVRNYSSAAHWSETICISSRRYSNYPTTAAPFTTTAISQPVPTFATARAAVSTIAKSATNPSTAHSFVAD